MLSAPPFHHVRRAISQLVDLLALCSFGLSPSRDSRAECRGFESRTPFPEKPLVSKGFLPFWALNEGEPGRLSLLLAREPLR
jgi:hypothetical protein